MRSLIPLLVLLAACGTTPSSGERSSKQDPDRPLPKEIQKEEKGLVVSRSTNRFTDERPVPKASAAEMAEFNRIWEHFRKDDPRWTLERERFKRRSEAAGYMLAGHLLRYYFVINSMRDRHAKELVRVKNEIVAVGQPCAPFLVDLMILDKIRMKDGRYFLTDDLTRKDCVDMLERMGAGSVQDLLAALGRKDLNVKGRRLVALALGGTRDPRAYEPLVELLLEDESWQVRADAATGLAKLGDRRAVEPLTVAVQKDPDPAVVKRAGKARYQLQGGR